MNGGIASSGARIERRGRLVRGGGWVTPRRKSEASKIGKTTTLRAPARMSVGTSESNRAWPFHKQPRGQDRV